MTRCACCFHATTTDQVEAKAVGDYAAACGAMVSAIQEVLGGGSFNRLPVTTDMIINALAKRPPAHTPLQVNCV